MDDRNNTDRMLEQLVSDNIKAFEGQEHLLYSDSSNPYESIYIEAKVEDGKLTVTDTEIGHPPDDGSSTRVISFDEEGTRGVFRFLIAVRQDPVQALSSMMDYQNRTSSFLQRCDKCGVSYESRLYIG